MYTLRNNQERAVQSIVDLVDGKFKVNSGLVVMPTAGGKSLVIGEAVKRLGRKVLVLQPSQELLNQNSKKYAALSGGKFSIYCAGLGEKEVGQVTFASLQSIKALGKSFRSMGFSILIVDEAHFSYDNKKTSMFGKFLKDLDPEFIVGLTATPFRIHRTLASTELKLLTTLKPVVFERLLHVTQIQEMIQNGWWSPFQYECYDIDDSNLKLNTSSTDYTAESIKENNKALSVNNLIYKRVKQLVSEGVKSILVFVDDLENADVFRNALPEYAAVLSTSTSKKDRKIIVEKFLAGEIKVLFNYAVLDTGFDFPDLECVIMGRPTKSFMTYYQILGRLVRVSENKNLNKRYIDYGNNVKRFGPIESFELKYVDKLGYRLISNNYVMSNVNVDRVKKTPHQLLNKLRCSDMIVDFGMYKGEYLCDVPLSYMAYMINKDMVRNQEIKKEMQKFINN